MNSPLELPGSSLAILAILFSLAVIVTSLMTTKVSARATSTLRAWLPVDQLGDRREAEAVASRRSRILADSIQDAVVEFDDQGIILFVSDNMSSVSEHLADNLIGQCIKEFRGFDRDSPAAHALLDLGRITEESIEETDQPLTTCYRFEDGSDHWFESTATTYRTTAGDLRILACTRDVTRRVEQELKNQESTLRLNRAERIANLGSWDYFPHEEKLFWSDQMYRLHGLTPKSGLMDLDLVRSLTLPNDFQDLMTSMLKDQSSNEAQYRIQRADDGKVRVLHTRGEIEKDANGRIVRVSGASMDITDQLALEERLRRGEQHFQALVDSNIAGVFFSEEGGEITDANTAFLSLIGYSRDDLPISWEVVAPPEDLDRDRQALKALAESGIALPYEKVFVSKDGERVPMLVGYARLDSDRTMGLAIDLSERIRAEAYIKQYQRKLEETIAERTSELMQSRDRLIENNRLAAVGTLAAGIAHQINNPIGAILNSSEFALLCRDEAGAVEGFEDALRVNLIEARRCAQIVKSMLLFSRDQPTKRWSEDLGDVVRRAHRAIAPYAADREALVEIQAEKRKILALICPIEIEQAIVNVLRNAIESRDRNASISLSLAVRDKNAEIEVLDDGRGISDDHRDHLLEPFFSTRTNEGGTGLGLSVAHGILTDHGGQIRIESIEGEGTRVLLSLPIWENGGSSKNESDAN